MNKTAIKNFAVWARNKLIADITYKAGLIGVSEKGIAQPLPQSSKDLQFFDIGTKEYAQVAGRDIEQRNALVRAIQEKERTSDYKTAYKAIIEEVAYTWFNRLVAIRFMEVNDYLPSRIRMLSSENPAKNEPDFVTTPFDTDLEFTVAEQDEVLRLKDENKLDELFRMLFIKQCNKLHEILPELFEETNNYTELLLSLSFTDKDGVVYHLVHDIAEYDFNTEKEGQVEIIGWMYQFYNIEPKAEVFSKKERIKKEEIPAATQLFTPDWIVRYMVENSLGHLWVEGHPNDSLKENWKYYLEEAEQEASVQIQLEKVRAECRNLNPEDIKVIDPCMGSGHILVYCFDVLMQIYEAQGYTQRDAAQSILENNLFGLDIDKRAAQLAYFAVMMKARQYDRRIFTRGIKPHVYAIDESNGINRGQLKYFGTHLTTAEVSKAKKEITALIDNFVDAKEYGSILNVEKRDWNLLERYVNDLDDSGQMSLDSIGIDKTQELLHILVMQGQVMSQKYDVVVTNPPYMAISSASPKLNEYVNANYLGGKTDLFATFIESCLAMTKQNRYTSMITMHSWMFLTSFEKLRQKILANEIINMAHLGARGFDEISGEVVQTTAFVLQKSSFDGKYNGAYVRLISGNSEKEKESQFLSKNYFFYSKGYSFRKIPQNLIAYWVSDKTINCFDADFLSKVFITREGMATADNDRFLRLWNEVALSHVTFDCSSAKDALERNIKWVPYNKGGTTRKWYGNNDYVVDWSNDGAAIRNNKDPKTGRIRSHNYNGEYGFREGLTWSAISSGNLSVRYCDNGFLFDSKGAKGFAKPGVSLNWIQGLLNSKVAMQFLQFISPTLDFKVGDIISLPYIVDDSKTDEIEALVEQAVTLSKEEWDSYETSWDFQEHPLVRISKGLWDVTAVGAAMHYYYNSHPKVSSPIELCYLLWQGECTERFNQVKDIEEKLNQLYIETYGLQEEINSELTDEDVTLRKADLGREIRSLLSYAVGCMFGRYSLDEPGIAYAGDDWDESKYRSFIPDKDNCIPITDEAYFEDDLVGQFVGWIKKVFGEEKLEENLDFIANALGNKGKTSREVIRNYFLNDFFKDHCTTYSVTGSGKRPIYWLFDSGKQNGFKALVYMHRWNADTVGNLRVEYLHRMQRVYESEITRMQEVIDNSRDSREVSAANKRKEKLQKQLKETKDYDAQIAHIALSRIDIDLDDGVKVNYEKVQTAPNGKVMKILAKI